MNITGLHHFTIRCDEEDLQPLEEFYVGVLGLHRGERPALRFPGRWLYADGAADAIVHLNAAGRAPSPEGVGLDHISFRTRGLAGTRAHLNAIGVAFTEAPLPGVPLHQLFVRDPIGLKLEMTFDMRAEEAQA